MPAEGVRRLNRSEVLDFEEIGRLVRVLRNALPQGCPGPEAIAASPEIRPIKVNASTIRDFTENEVVGSANWPAPPTTSSASWTSCRSKAPHLGAGHGADGRRVYRFRDSAGETASSTRS
jgi:hypothetical protein